MVNPCGVHQGGVPDRAIPATFPVAATITSVLIRRWLSGLALGVVTRTHSYANAPAKLEKQADATSIAFEDGLCRDPLTRFGLDPARVSFRAG